VGGLADHARDVAALASELIARRWTYPSLVATGVV
jgi:hypothetical protein